LVHDPGQGALRAPKYFVFGYYNPVRPGYSQGPLRGPKTHAALGETPSLFNYAKAHDNAANCAPCGEQANLSGFFLSLR
jgi:hypothetical protein